MLFYYADIFDVHYLLRVDHNIYVDVHDNIWWHWSLINNANFVMDYSHYIGVIDVL